MNGMTESISTPCWVVVPASGIGTRMKSDLPKQYLPLLGKTILEHTLDRLLEHPDIDGAVLVLNEQDHHWGRLGYQSNKPVLTCTGGAERFLSVFYGLKFLSSRASDDTVVLIHDAVRPCISMDELTLIIREIAANPGDGALLATPVADTLKLENSSGAVEKTISREKLWRAMTPQGGMLNIVMAALETVIGEEAAITDDAAAIEYFGRHPKLVQGSVKNIKITHPEDLELARLIMQSQIQ